MRKLLRILSLALLNVVMTYSVVFGQSSPPPPVAPEVVSSIKPSNSADTRVSVSRSPGMFVATNYTVRSLIWMAYELQPIELMNVPLWAIQDRFDFVAKSEDRSPAPAAMRQMLKVLLAERFNLVLHKETRVLPIYALVLDRSDGKLGTKLRVSTMPCRPGALTATGERPCGLFGGPLSQMQADGVTMAQVARLLSSVSTVQRFVVDRTGLSGKYDLDLSFSQEVSPGDPDAPPSVFTALKEQLGLQLRAETAPMEVTIVDRLEKPQPN